MLFRSFFRGKHKGHDYKVLALLVVQFGIITASGLVAAPVVGSDMAFGVCTFVMYGFMLLALCYRWYFTLHFSATDFVMPVILHILVLAGSVTAGLDVLITYSFALLVPAALCLVFVIIELISYRALQQLGSRLVAVAVLLGNKT